MNPLRTRRFAGEDLQRTQTDAIDAVGIARFVAQKLPPANRLPDRATAELRELVRFRDRLRQDFGDRVRQLHRLVDLGFPEFTRQVRDLGSELATALLREYPTAAGFHGVPVRRVAALRYDGRHKVGEDLAAALIVAAGARHAYFGHDEWEANAPGLKTIEDAVEIRRRLLLAFEKAEREALLGSRPDPPTFAVVGGGPTGVELAGAIADLARLALAKDFKAIDTSKARVRLYEGGSHVLGTFSEQSARRGKEQLQQLGVEVFTDSMVTAVEPGRIKVGDQWTATEVTLWATGVAASQLGKELGAKTDRAGRVLIEPDLSVPGHREIFVIGDMSALSDENGRPVPGLAAAATQQGKAAAENILGDLHGEPRRAFRYRDRGTMATVGYKRAVAEFGNTRLSGLPAWLLWSLVHVLLLIGFRNRVTVMGQWIWAYFTRAGSSPLITEYQTRDSRTTRTE